MRFPDHLKGHRRFFKMDIWHLLDLFCFICWFGWIPFWVLNKEDWNIVPANPVVLCSFPLFLIFIMCLCASVCLFEVPCPQPCFHFSFKYSWKAKPLVWFLVFCAQITNIAMNPHSRTTCPDDSNTKRSAALRCLYFAMHSAHCQWTHWGHEHIVTSSLSLILMNRVVKVLS